MEPQANRLKHNSKSDRSIAGLYDLERSLGSGHFAVVKLARHVFTGEKVAVKVIDKTKLDDVAKAHLYQEVRCMKLVQHPNVVRLYEVIDTQTKLYLILEYGDGGDMYDHIMRYEGKGISESQARHYFKQIVSAIDYCHKLHVVHRDLKPENVIFFKSQDLAKLTDFGFSNSFLPGEKLYTSCGSLAYSAPEILLGDSYDAPAVDVWSLGVILYMMVCGKGPFNHANDSETLTMIMDCKYELPDELSKECKSLISRMLVRLPNHRASLSSIVNDPWVRQGNQSDSDKLLVAPNKPLISEIHISKEIHLAVLQKMEFNKVAAKEEIEKSLKDDKYDHVTATYFLFAERILKRRLGSVALHVRLEERHSYPYEYLAKKHSIDKDTPPEINDTSTASSTYEDFDYPLTNDLTKEHSQSDECLSDNSSTAFETQISTSELQTKTLPARSRLSFPPTLYTNKKTKSTPNLLNGITEENESELEDSPRTSPILQRRSSQRRRKYHTCRLSPIHSRRSSCSSSDDDDMYMFTERRRLATLVNTPTTQTNTNDSNCNNNSNNNQTSKSNNNEKSQSHYPNNLSTLDFENEDYLSKKMASFLDNEERNNLLNLLLPTLNLKGGTNATSYGRHLSDTNLTSYSRQLQVALAKIGAMKHANSNSNIKSLVNNSNTNNHKQKVQKKSSSDTNLISTLYKEKHNILFSSDFFKSKDFFARYLKMRNGTRCSSKNSSNLSLSSPIEEEPTSDLPFRCNEDTPNVPINGKTDFVPIDPIDPIPIVPINNIIVNHRSSTPVIENIENAENLSTVDLHENDIKIEECNKMSMKRQISTYTTRRAIQVVPAKNTGSVCCSLV